MKNILPRHRIIKLLKTGEKERILKVEKKKLCYEQNTGKDESRVLVRSKASCKTKE